MCWFAHVVSLTLEPRSEVCSRRVETGGEAGRVADELKSTRLALKLAPSRGSSLVATPRHKLCPLAGQASDYSSLAGER